MDDLAFEIGAALDTLTPLPEQTAPAETQTIPAEAPEKAPAVEPEAPVTSAVEQQSAAPAVAPQDPNPLPGTHLDDPDFDPATVQGPEQLPAATLRAIETGWDFGNLSEVKGMVIHHTAGRGTVDGVVSTLNQRKLGVQFVIDRDGSIYQLTRDGGKAYHMRTGWGPKGSGLSNDNMEGVEVIAMNDKDVTPKQVEAVKALVEMRAKKWGYDPKTSVFGHGEVNPGHKEADEGMSSVNLIRGASKINVPSDVMSILEEASARTGVSKEELIRAAKQESNFNPNAKSPSGATGLFQFLPKTWQFALREWGDIHGIPSNADPRDPRYNAILGAEYIKHVSAEIKDKTGRYVPGEYYLGHFLGPTGGSNLIKLMQSDPNAPAAASFPKAAASNQSVFYNRDGSMKTAKEVYDWAVAIGSGGNAPAAVVSTGSPATPGRPAYAPSQNTPPRIVGSTEAKLIEDAKAAADTEGSYTKLMADTFRYDLTPGLLFARQTFTPNPASIPDLDDTIKKWKDAGVSPELIQKRIPEIVSGEHEQFMFQQAVAETSHYKNMAALGVPGMATNILMNMLDPVAVAAGIASGGFADYAIAAARLGRVARIGGQMAAGAGSNLAIEALQSEMGSATALENPALSIAFGAAFGAIGGMLGRNPYTRAEASRIADLAEAEVRRIHAEHGAEGLEPVPVTGKDLSAAVDPNADIPIVNDAAIRAVSDNDIPYTTWGAIRWDIVGRMKSSKNPLVRGLGSVFGEDAVGNKDKSRPNSFSADQDMQRRHDKNTLDMWRSFHPAFDEWAKERGFNAVTKRLRYRQFFDELYDVDTGLVPKDAHGPAVQRMSAKLDELYAERAKDLSNPWWEEGLVGPAYPGFDGGAPIQNYRPRIYDLRKVNDFRLNGGGDAGIRAWFRGAIKSAQPEIDNDVLDKMSEGIAKQLHLRSEGVWEDLERVKGGDKEGLANWLSDLGLNDDEIERAMKKFAPPEKAGDARGKHRIALDERYTLEKYRMKDGTSRDVTIKDFVKTNPIENYVSYDRWHSGRVAMMRVRLEGGVDPEDAAKRTLLVNGFRTQSDFDGFLKHVQAKGAELNVGEKQMAEDLENLKWMHDRLLGRPDPNLQGNVPQFLRAMRKFNFIRLMGQMGFAQAVEHAKIVANLGLKATYSQMPAFRRIVDAKGQLVFRDGLMRDLEAIGGQGADDLRGLQNMHAEDLYAPAYEGIGRKINFALDVGQRITSQVSGMHLVDGMLMRHAQKAIAQRFTDMAFTAMKDLDGPPSLSKISASDLNRLRTIGLDDKMLERVLRQARENFSTADGALFDHKVTRLNLDKWSDQEARAAFEKSLYNWSRRIILRNDIGNAARWMSTPMATTLLQFRSFMLNSWAKDTLYNLHQGDMRALMSATYSMMFAAMVYSVQTKARSIGRSDADKFLEEQLSWSSLVRAGFSRAGVSSIFPMMIDTTMPFIGYDPLFDFRSSAQASDILLGNPTFGLINDLQKAGSSVFQPMRTGRTTSQQDYRNWLRVMPFGNSMPLMNLYSAMIHNAPERTEKLSKEERKLF